MRGVSKAGKRSRLARSPRAGKRRRIEARRPVKIPGTSRRAASAGPSSGQSPYHLEVQEKRGTLTVLAPGGATVLDSFWLELEMENGDVLTTCQSGLSAGAKGWSAELANGRIAVSLHFRRSLKPPGALIWASVTNRSTTALELKQVRLARAALGGGKGGPADPAAWRVLRAGPPADSGLREEGKDSERLLVRMERELSPVRCPGMAALHFSSKAPALLAGFVTADRQVAWIEIKRDREEVEFSAVCDMEGAPVLPGTSVSTEKLYLALHADLFAGLAGYAELCARSCGASPRPAQAGWCPPGEAAGAPDPAHPALKVFRIGKGHQRFIGDWLSEAEELPKGLAEAAARIQQAGGIPGIWIAPFAVHPSSRLFGAHPDWLVKDAAGKPLAWDFPAEEPEGFLHALDSSIPEVREWLSGVFRALRGAGFRHFMLDLLDLGCGRGKRANRATRSEAYREGLRAIRRGAQDAYLLGCRAPWTASVGLLDGMASGISGEASSAAKWSADSLAETHLAFWAHGILWNADPPPVSAGESGEAPSETWARMLSAALTGGSLFFCASSPEPAAERGRLISAALNLQRPIAAVPMDLFSEEKPRLLLQRIGRERFRLGIFNFGDAARVVPVDLGILGLARARVRELDGGRAKPVWSCARRLLTPPVPARGGLLLMVEGY